MFELLASYIQLNPVSHRNTRKTKNSIETEAALTLWIRERNHFGIRWRLCPITKRSQRLKLAALRKQRSQSVDATSGSSSSGGKGSGSLRNHVSRSHVYAHASKDRLWWHSLIQHTLPILLSVCARLEKKYLLSFGLINLIYLAVVII